MKKLITMFATIICVIGFVACSNKGEVLHLGIDATIQEIDIEKRLS